jgi:putative GTP pyrophosphokinase
MAEFTLTGEQNLFLDELVDHYVTNQGPIKRLLDSIDGFISDAEVLAPLIHSVKKRMKDPASLKDKLIRTLREVQEAGAVFGVNKENIFTEITDLGGYRILHLHTRQTDRINAALLRVLKEEAQCTVIEGPKANVWDQESKSYFESIGIETKYNPRMYSSVHYVVQPNSKIKVTIEIQLRTLSEEIWGEVDHKFNYPHSVDNVACREQIKVLARVASSCTRLVDSIFASYDDWQATKIAPLAQPNAGSEGASQAQNSPGEPHPGHREG